MLAWRLCRKRYADLDGLGAARVGGRWNPIGFPMVYMSSTDALAVLEVRVHLPRYIPESFVFVTAEIPDILIQRVEDRQDFPPDWRESLEWSRFVGHRFLTELWSVALSVPSKLVPSGRNLLLNPRHPDFSQIVVYPTEPFHWDERLWERMKETFRPV